MATVIIADDDEGYCEMLKDFLESRGHRVIRAFDVAQLWTQLRTIKPDLMVLDLQMPAGGGPAAMSCFRASGLSALPVIICSGMPVEHQVEWGKKRGLTNFRCHQKPVDLFEFSRILGELLKSKAPPPGPSTPPNGPL